jgi:oligosaccharyltransferase complex subunit beta
VQGLNNARAIFSGSLDLFSDEFFAFQNMDNELFVDNFVRWCFKQTGILRVSNIKYYAVGKNSESLYTCNDKAHYQLDIEEYD